MRAAFATVDVLRYPDSLVVTEVAPLIDYVNSTRIRARVTDEQIAALKMFFEKEISERGAIHITRDAGMFLARA